MRFLKKECVDKDKIATILNWPLPKSVKRIRVHQKVPLMDLLKKDSYQWDQRALDTFNDLKQLCTSTGLVELQ